MKGLLSISWIYVLFCFGCVGKKVEENNPDSNFSAAREYFDDEHHEIAIKKLGEFVVRFPYSKHVATAQLLISESHYELGEYPEAIAGYRQLVKLYPKHEKLDYVLYRIGEAYWKQAPDDEDRDQGNTKKAIQAWQRFVEVFPQAKLAPKARKLMLEGGERVAKADRFVAKFYCKLGKWHACAHRYYKMAENNGAYKALAKDAYNRAADALEKIRALRSRAQGVENMSQNLYTERYTDSELVAEISKRRQKAQAISFH